MLLKIVRRTVHRGFSTFILPIHDFEQHKYLPLGQTGEAKFVMERSTEWTRMVPDDIWYAAQPKPIDMSKRDPICFLHLASLKSRCMVCSGPRTVLHQHKHLSYTCADRRTTRCEDLRFSYDAIERIGWKALDRTFGGLAETAFSDEMRRLVEAEIKRGQEEGLELKRRYDDLTAQIVRLKQIQADERLGLDDINQSMIREKAIARADVAEEMAELKEIGDPEQFWNDRRLEFSEAFEVVQGRIPFRPRNRAERKVLELARDALDSIEMVQTESGLFDVVVTCALRVGDSRILMPHAMKDVNLLDKLGAKDTGRRRLVEGMADGSWEREAAGVPPEWLENYRWRFGEDDDILMGIVAAVILRLPPRSTFLRMGLSRHRTSLANNYWRTLEGVQLQLRLQGRSVDSVPVLAMEIGSPIPTMRRRMELSSHPLLRYPPADPASEETGISDADWLALVNAGLASVDGQLILSGRCNDRRYFDAFLWLIRNDARQDDLPPNLGQIPRMTRMLRAIDNRKGAGPITSALLEARGVLGVDPDTVPLFNDASLLNRRYRDYTKSKRS